MRIALVIGHNVRSKGAFSPYLKRSEFDFYNEVIDCMVLAGDGYYIDVFQHNENISGYNARIKNTATRVNKGGYDLAIELHFNAFSDKRANGCETLYFFASKKGREYASKFSQVVNIETGIKLRNGGLKALANKNDRGFASVYYTKAPTILIEPFFGTNERDCNKIESADNMGRIILNFIKSII